MNTFGSDTIRREKGEQVPASIGTSLAVESFLNVGDFYDEKRTPPYYHSDELWVNLRTLFRNAYGSIEDSSARKSIRAEDLVDPMYEDAKTIESSVIQAAKSRVKVRFYLTTMNGLKKTFPHAYLKEPSTELQIFQHKLEEATIQGFLDNSPDIDLDVFNVKILTTGKKTTIITHHPIDLLWYKRFSKLSLLESHTGKVKERAQWPSKLTGGDKLSRIPFNRLTLQVFGDGNNLFKSAPLKYRRALLEVAESNKWTPMSTMEKIRFGIQRIEDKEISQLFEDMIRE